jgi:predicted MFS family arabinose efflux permease
MQDPQSTVGIYLAAIPVGMVCGAFVAGRFLSPTTQLRIIVPGAVLVGLALLAFPISPTLSVTFGVLVAVGVGSCFSLPLSGTLLQAAPLSIRNSALAIEQAGLMFLQGVAFTVWGAVGELLPITTTIALAGACAVATALFLGTRVIVREPRDKARGGLHARP